MFEKIIPHFFGHLDFKFQGKPIFIKETKTAIFSICRYITLTSKYAVCVSITSFTRIYLCGSSSFRLITFPCCYTIARCPNFLSILEPGQEIEPMTGHYKDLVIHHVNLTLK